MVRFLSPEWLAAAHRGVCRAAGVTTDGVHHRWSSSKIVEHPDGIRSAYRIRLHADGAEALGGFSDNATVVYRQSYEVARGIAGGELDAHVEFLMGRVVDLRRHQGPCRNIAPHSRALSGSARRPPGDHRLLARSGGRADASADEAQFGHRVPLGGKFGDRGVDPARG